MERFYSKVNVGTTTSEIANRDDESCTDDFVKPAIIEPISFSKGDYEPNSTGVAADLSSKTKANERNVRKLINEDVIGDIHECIRRPVGVQSIPLYSPHSRPACQGFQPNFREILFEYLDKPASHQREIFFQTSNCIVIYDGFPKSRVHLLVIPKRHFMSCDAIDSLKTADLDKTRELHELARTIISSASLQSYLKGKTAAEVSELKHSSLCTPQLDITYECLILC
jgi:hypothetical protein